MPQGRHVKKKQIIKGENTVVLVFFSNGQNITKS